MDKKARKRLGRMKVMAIMTQTAAEQSLGYQAKDVMKDLLGRLDEAIDDMEQGRVQTLEEAWAEIDAI